MEDASQPPPLPFDVNFEITSNGYEVWFSDRISSDHPELVDQCGEWMEEEVGAINLGQVEHRVLLADGVLTDEMKKDIVAWWTERVEDLIQE